MGGEARRRSKTSNEGGPALCACCTAHWRSRRKRAGRHDRAFPAADAAFAASLQALPDAPLPLAAALSLAMAPDGYVSAAAQATMPEADTRAAGRRRLRRWRPAPLACRQPRRRRPRTPRSPRVAAATKARQSDRDSAPLHEGLSLRWWAMADQVGCWESRWCVEGEVRLSWGVGGRVVQHRHSRSRASCIAKAGGCRGGRTATWHDVDRRAAAGGGKGITRTYGCAIVGLRWTLRRRRGTQHALLTATGRNSG